MDDALLVGFFETFGDLPRDGDGFVRGDRAALQPFREVLAFDQLHGEEVNRGVVRQGRALKAVYVSDVGVIERGEDLRLALESRQPFRITGHRRR